MNDKYDRAIEVLLEASDFKVEAEEAWNAPLTHEAGCLFQFASKSGRFEEPTVTQCDSCGNELMCGCLTLIRETVCDVADTPELTEAIRADERIPTSPRDITPEDLPVFAEWQRRLDKELEREVAA